MKIDGTDLKDIGIRAKLESDLPAAPSMRNKTLVIPGKHGAYDFGAEFEPLELELECRTLGKSNADIQEIARTLKRLLIDEYGRPKTVQFITNYEEDKFYNVRLSDGISIERLVYAGDFNLPLTAFDPFAYSIEETTISELTTTNKITTNNGDMVSYPIIEIESLPGQVQSVDMGGEEEGNELDNLPLLNPKITLRDKTLTFNGEITGTLIIDYAKYTAKHGSANAMPKLSGEWGELRPGDNIISITDDNNSDGSIKITHRGRWL